MSVQPATTCPRVHAPAAAKLGLVWGAPRLPNASRVPKTLRQLLPKAPAGSRTPPSASLSSLGTVAESESATPTAGSPNSSPENKLYHARSNSSTAAFTPSLGTEQQEAGQGSSRIVLDLDVRNGPMDADKDKGSTLDTPLAAYCI
ncbi:hypothetical protein BC831DRAFT_514537 [Entophlyctis helioformis]|nr:hypothetical protein BC831DRAFT_514537 [Entophlyctis helioformis]